MWCMCSACALVRLHWRRRRHRALSELDLHKQRHPLKQAAAAQGGAAAKAAAAALAAVDAEDAGDNDGDNDGDNEVQHHTFPNISP